MNQIDIIKAIVGVSNSGSEGESFFTPGKKVFIRTVTYYYTGEVVKVTGKEIILTRAAWIASSGRFTQAVDTAEFDEVEVFPQHEAVLINREAVVDAVEIHHLPSEQK